VISNHLIDDLEPYLDQAEEVWIAVALMKDAGLEELQSRVKKGAKQHFLVGIDLPTSPSALRSLQKMESSNLIAGIIQQAETFHPKLYIIRTGEALVSFVGSAILTSGGLKNNTELTLKTTDPNTSKTLIEWFNQKFSESFPLTDSNIALCEARFKTIKEIDDKKNVDVPKIKLIKPQPTIGPLDGIDFSTRFFSQEHHLAFRGELWEQRTPAANRERFKAHKRFLKLHEIIYPRFANFALQNLFHHNYDENIVSHYYHIDRFTSKQLDSMWLSYGKSDSAIAAYQRTYEPGLGAIGKEKDRSTQTFSHHARLQIRIELKQICLWLFFGKMNGSVVDRDHFRQKMKSEPFRQSFFDLVAALPSGYYISLSHGSSKYVNTFEAPDDLYQYCKQEKIENHFYIGKDYQITDTEMSIENLPITVLTEFQRLYPLYNLMRDKQFG
jgi:HKD family nuclease